MKRCSQCGEAKDLADYNRRAASPDGLKSECKTCMTKRNRARYASDPKRFLAQSKAWVQAYPERNREMKRLAAARRYRADPATGRENTRRWREAHPDAGAIFYEKNKERENTRLREWRRANPEKRLAQDIRRRARKNGAPGTATAAQIAARFAMWGNKCWMCGNPADTVDHMIPLSRGGSNWPANLRPACRSCNSRKGTRRIAA